MNLRNSEKLKSMKDKQKAKSLKQKALIALCLLLCMQLQAQVITLDSVLAVIDRQNPMLQENDSRVKALNTYAEGATSWMAPMIGVGTFMTPYSKPEATHGNPDPNEGSWMFSIE